MDPSSDHEYDYDYNYGFAEMLLLFLLAHATPILDSLQIVLQALTLMLNIYCLLCFCFAEELRSIDFFSIGFQLSAELFTFSCTTFKYFFDDAYPSLHSAYEFDWTDISLLSQRFRSENPILARCALTGTDEAWDYECINRSFAVLAASATVKNLLVQTVWVDRFISYYSQLHYQLQHHFVLL
ncbi:uncharacterized protein LOC142345360 [Convolutriloba macropyga]|uniref:uncharacterized protein LOC142345360 n=1 Tax=Convolutriloba macropyga TaxID=536237 RepID=UPI003F522686